MNSVQIPKNADMPMATVMLCEGIQIYRALKETKIHAGQIIAIPGAGGSLGNLAIQFARAMGFRVLALDRAHKEDKCRMLGADFFVDAFGEEKMFAEIVRLTDGGPHAVLSCSQNLSSVEQVIINC
jgi:propanol-preferring alcohol dehydrogenase